MNIKALLIEKERIEYIGGNVGMAMFLSNVLDYVIELEEAINRKDVEIEQFFEPKDAERPPNWSEPPIIESGIKEDNAKQERDRICDALMKLHNSKAWRHNYYLWLANELKEGRL